MAETYKIDSNTWRIEDGFVRFFLLEGSDKAAMIDSGVACPNAAELAAELTDKPVMLINTHGDGDHTSGTGSFEEIYIHPLDYEGCGIREKFPNTVPVALEDGETIDLGDRPLKIIHIPGHTRGSVAILDVKKRVLYGGDSIQCGHMFMFGAHRDVESYEASLEKIIAMEGEFDIIYPSHHEPSVPGNQAEKVLEVWRKVRNGELPYETTDVFGTTVKSYTCDGVGFYME